LSRGENAKERKRIKNLNREIFLRSSFVDFVISSNHDNLVRKAGVPDDRLAELFGNAYVEMCLKCKQPFQRSTITPALGRKCESCRGRLVKTGVRYGQEIPAEPYRRAQEEARTQPAGTVSLVLGSGMHTSPIPDFSLMSQRVVVVNLGPTACDGHRRVLKVESSTDDFMQALCGALGVDIPPFVFRQAFRVAVRAADDGDDELKVSVTAARTNESVTFARGVEILPLRDGCVAELVEPDLHWQFQARVRRADRVRVTLLPRSEYDGAAPIVVELDATTPTEQECEFVHSV
jgi:hypothetical protein